MFPEIVCPIDNLRLTKEGESLTCPNGHCYSVRLGIPRMVTQESNYTDAFGDQWKIYKKTQLDSYTGTTISRDRVRRCLGDNLWNLLHSQERADVLEAGCGAGRFTEILLSTPSAFITSTDYSCAVEANQDNVPQNNRHRVVQADILFPPFLPQQFDVVLCLGVIQHTPCPEETILKLYGMVKPGGCLVFDHYTYSLSHFTRPVALLLRPILKRLKSETGLIVTELLVKAFFPLHRAVRKSKLLQMLLSRISPVLTYYHALPYVSDQLQYEWALLDTHDSLTDYYKHLRTKKQILKTLTSIGAGDIWCEYGGNGVEGRCHKPL